MARRRTGGQVGVCGPNAVEILERGYSSSIAIGRSRKVWDSRIRSVRRALEDVSPGLRGEISRLFSGDTECAAVDAIRRNVMADRIADTVWHSLGIRDAMSDGLIAALNVYVGQVLMLASGDDGKGLATRTILNREVAEAGMNVLKEALKVEFFDKEHASVSGEKPRLVRQRHGKKPGSRTNRVLAAR